MAHEYCRTYIFSMKIYLLSLFTLVGNLSPEYRKYVKQVNRCYQAIIKITSTLAMYDKTRLTQATKLVSESTNGSRFLHKLLIFRFDMTEMHLAPGVG